MPKPVTPPDHPLIPAEQPQMVTNDDDLAKLVEHVREKGSFAYDTEFIGESSYYPHLCLIQIATDGLVGLVDPLKGASLEPIFELIADPELQTLVHAGAQDLEPVQRIIGKAPANVFDTQVAAGFCGQPYPVSLQHLVSEYADVKLGKGMTFTRWDNRPLSETHLHYAADDVRYLPLIHSKLIECLQTSDLYDLAMQACEELGNADTSRPSPDDQFRRLVKNNRLNRRAMAVLRSLTCWRDEAAREQDLPPRAMLRDDVLTTLAKKPARSVDNLSNIRHMPRPVMEQYGEQIVNAINEALDTPKADWPSIERFEEGSEERFDNDAVWASLTVQAMSRGIDPTVMTTRAEVARLMRDYRNRNGVESHRLMTGWRKELLGDWFTEFLKGTTTLTYQRNHTPS